MKWSFRSTKPEIKVASSLGLLELTQSEYQLLERALTGTATAAEGQQLYKTVTARGLPFPLEWEAAVIRVTLVELPDREDLRQRLAVVDATLADTAARTEAQSTDYIAWERAHARFSETSLIAPTTPAHAAMFQEQCFADACTLLSNPCFRELTVERRAETILALHDTLMSAPSPDLAPLAELGLRQFRRMLEDPGLTEAQAMGVYDALHSLYFSGVSDVQDLRRFDAIVPAFEDWLGKRSFRTTLKNSRAVEGDPMTVAYLLHTAHFDRGNAVSRLITSLAESHAGMPDRRILLYLVQYVGPGFVDELSSSGVTVRSFPQSRNYDQIDRIAASLREDRVDVLITEQNRSIAAALFVRRVAPIQIWADTGFPFWNLKALDWTLSPVWNGPPDPVRKINTLTWRQKPETLLGAADPMAVAEVRSQFPEDAFVLGVFVRLVKLTPDFFDLLDRLLAAEPTFCLVITGTGDDKQVRAFIESSSHKARIVFRHENVDLNIYGQAVDVMCDTFPFIGGNACREVGAHGTPVVSMLGTPWDNLLRNDRSPDLLAYSVDEYIALVTKLHSDKNFLERQREITLTLYNSQIDPLQMIKDVETAIRAARQEVRKNPPSNRSI